MKAAINRMLKPFGVELHGANYIKKLASSHGEKNAFRSQKKWIPQAKIIIDAGANRGEVTAMYTQLYPEAAIHCFEPFPDFREPFLQRHGKNGNVHWINKALSDADGCSDYFVNRSVDTNSLLEPVVIGATSDKACANLEKTEVVTETLDAYCRRANIAAIDILKMDTQGSELAILQGAKELLSEQKISLIYTETYFQVQYREQPLFYDIANFLKPFGYFLEDIYDPYYNQQFLLWCDAIFLPKRK